MCTAIQRGLHSLFFLPCVLALASGSVLAQDVASSLPVQSQVDLAAKIDALTGSVDRMQRELEESHREIQQLREVLAHALRSDGNASVASEIDQNAALSANPQTPVTAASAAPAPASTAPPAQISEDDWQIINARVEEHEQVKVDSASKYRLSISGIALFNVFDTSGQVDNLDAPNRAAASTTYGSGSLSASFRQSILGLRGIGPRILRASTSADLQMDFLNGATPYGVGAGIVGLRIARVQFDWINASVAAGLDAPFFSPNSPTSYLSLAIPAFASAGNLWNWTPTLRAERRFDFNVGEVKLEGGFLDSAGYSVGGRGLRVPTPGEASREPVYAVRLSGNNRSEDHSVSFGISGIYVPLRFSEGTEPGFGMLADWKFPLISKLQLSGAFFSGKGLDGFGGLALPILQHQDYLHYLYITAPTLASISELGGWSQLKFTLNSRNEFNLAGGLGERDAGQLRAAANSDSLLQSLPPENRVFFINYIFKPRSDLLFSLEYRRFYTGAIAVPQSNAGQIGAAAGFLF